MDCYFVYSNGMFIVWENYFNRKFLSDMEQKSV